MRRLRLSINSPYLSPMFLSTHNAVKAELNKAVGLRQMSPQYKSRFAYDLTFVAMAVRSGYLVDVVAPTDPTAIFSRLILRLRKKSDLFNSIIHLYEPNSEQSFFINILLLEERINSILSSTTCLNDTPVKFIHIRERGSTELLPEPPAMLISVLRSLMLQVKNHFDSPSITLPVTQITAVALAGILIDYPATYAPESATQTAFLSGVTLDIYECRLVWKQSGEMHPHALSPNQVLQNLRTNIEQRLLHSSVDATLELLHTVDTFDRVAL